MNSQIDFNDLLKVMALDEESLEITQKFVELWERTEDKVVLKKVIEGLLKDENT